MLQHKYQRSSLVVFEERASSKRYEREHASRRPRNAPVDPTPLSKPSKQLPHIRVARVLAQVGDTKSRVRVPVSAAQAVHSLARTRAAAGTERGRDVFAADSRTAWCAGVRGEVGGRAVVGCGGKGASASPLRDRMKSNEQVCEDSVSTSADREREAHHRREQLQECPCRDSGR